jgi:TetR/AcrR family transcriptional regulator
MNTVIDAPMAGGVAQRRPGAKRVLNEARILAAAESVFAEAGYAAASMAAIADRAGLPKANLHYYFGTKRQLYQRLLEHIIEAWQQSTGHLRADADPAWALRLYIAEKIEFSRQRPRASKIFANEIMHGAPAIAGLLRGPIRQWLDSKAAVIERWIADGRIKPVDPRHLFFVIWAATQHYADFDVQVAALLGHSAVEAQDYAKATDTITSMVLAALGLEDPKEPQ